MGGVLNRVKEAFQETKDKLARAGKAVLEGKKEEQKEGAEPEWQNNPLYLNRVKAVRFSKTPLPADYNPAPYNLKDNGTGRTSDRIVPSSEFLNVTIDQYLESNSHAGVILIHLSEEVTGMEKEFDKRKCLDHIRSALQVAKKKGCDVCVLYIHDPPLMAPLENEVKGMPNRANVKESTGHMGGKQEVFQKFAKDHQNVVVMGFDATVCVEANMFGAPELRSGVVVEQGKKPRSEDFVAPLTTLTNVVTSRAVLVTDATIYSKVDKGQWGCLKGL